MLSNAKLTAAPQESVADAAYRRIEAMIVTRVLQPGSMISENQLAVEMHCGRTPIREALQRLKHEGFVEIHPRRGALVTPIDITRQLELLEVRRQVEQLVIQLAAERATAAERTRMIELADELTEAADQGDRLRYLATNRMIHELRVQTARNSILTMISGPINGLSRRFWYSYIEDTDSFREAARLHSAILHATAAGTNDERTAAVSALLDFLENLTRRAIERRL